jgi:hypothetical protein
LNDLTFERESHTYRVGGAIKPSLTQIIRAVKVQGIDPAKRARSLFDYSFLNPNEADAVLLRGRWVHDLVALHLNQGPLSEEVAKRIRNTAPDWWPYFGSFLRWFETNPTIAVEFVETPMYSPRLDFCTTPDFVCVLRAEPTIVELKTGMATDDAKIQTAGQAMALEEQVGYSHRDKLHQRFALELHADGKPGTLIPHRDHVADRANFMALLRVYRLLTQEG